MKDFILIIQTHELGYVMDYLMDEYFKAWNPFKKKKLREIMNKFHRYMFPKDKTDLFPKKRNRAEGEKGK